MADPSIIFDLCSLANTIAESLAWYLGEGSCCLYEFSCSSSITIKPRLLNGKNKDDLAPIII